MSWIQKLYETYELCANAPQFENEPLLPVSHTEQQAHIEIILDQSGTKVGISYTRVSAIEADTTANPDPA